MTIAPRGGGFLASSSAVDVRWLKRYRLFWIGGLVVLGVQIILAYSFLAFDAARDSQPRETLSGRGRLSIEFFEDVNIFNSPGRRDSLGNTIVGDDDEEDSMIGNSNAIYEKIKVPPDKPDSKNGRSPIKSNKISDNKTVALRVDELDFTPMCEIKTKEAISAIHRARTQHCKQLIANTTCLINGGELYPNQLPHFCPNNGLEKGKSLGCFQDDKTARIFKDYYVNLKNNSPTNCINVCLQSGFPYAGVQYGSECFCGVSEPPKSARLPDPSCNMKCPADPKKACGGFFTINVYQTGVTRLSKEPVVETWLKKHSDNRLSDKDSRVRIVFLLTLNGRAVRQVKRLMRVLFHSSHFFYIHVDARQDYMMRELLQLEMRYSNVRLCRRRHATIWGGASLLTMLLEAMTDLVQSGWQWDFVINLSESDFPVKTNDQLVDFLTANRERNFVKSHGREVQRFIQKQGLDKTFVECDAHMWRIGDRALPNGIVVDGGSDWLALSRSFVEYLVTSSTESLIQGLTVIFKYTLLPAESFFHTVLRNSVFCNSYVDNNLHVTNWRRRLGCKCQYKHIVDWCGCSPNNYKTEDWARITGTELKAVFFARKFEPIIEQSVINQLESWLYGEYPRNTSGLDSFWQSVYHSEDMSPAPDDSLISIGLSLSRASVRITPVSNCSLTVSKLIEISVYHKQDAYMGSLILFDSKARTNGQTVRFESWIEPVDRFTVLRKLAPSKRIKKMFVSSDYDLKEQVSRNSLRSLGPLAEPCAVFELTSVTGESYLYNVTLLWIDPVGNVVAVNELAMDDNLNSSHFVKPSNLKTPLLPGAWTVRLAWNATIFAQTEFLVTPLESVSGTPLSLSQAKFVHRGPGELYRKLNEEWGKFVNGHDNKYDRKALERKAFSNAKRVGKDLTIWIDSLTSRFYRIKDICIVNPSPVCQLQTCSTTSWSSHSPDPKSELSSINKSGRINRW